MGADLFASGVNLETFTPSPSRSRSRRQAAPTVPWQRASAPRGSNWWRRQRTSGGCSASARAAGPISSALWTAASMPRPIATSSDRLHGSMAIPVKPASPRMRCTRASEAKANGPGSSGPLRRQFRDVLVDGLQRRHEERIFARLPPAGESQPPRWPHPPTHIGEGERRLGEKHHAEAGGQKIEARGGKRINGRIRQHEFDRQARRRDLPGAGQHRPGNVDAQHMAAWANLLRQRDRDRAAAAADIDNPLARIGPARGRSGGRRPAPAECPATAADRPSAGRRVRSSRRSGPRLGRGLTGASIVQTRLQSAPAAFVQIQIKPDIARGPKSADRRDQHGNERWRQPGQASSILRARLVTLTPTRRLVGGDGFEPPTLSV